MPVNDTTANRAYQKPNIANTLADDVGRLRSALDSIDTDMASKAPSAGPTFTGVTTVAAGSAAAPSLTFTGATGDTGLYSPGADQVAISTGGTGRLFVDASGNVGVNTATPSSVANSVLHVYRGLGLSSAIRVTGNNATGIDIIQAADSSCYIYQRDNSFIAIGTNNAERARITSTGNVGIGTSSPGSTLTVVGDAKIGPSTDTNGYLTVDGATNSYLALTSTNGYVGAESNLILCTNNTGTERARIDSSGRLLVGTSSSTGHLAGTQSNLQLSGTSAAAASVAIFKQSADTFGSFVVLSKARSGPGIVSSGDQLGGIYFNGHDGTDYENSGAAIEAYVDGTPGSNDMPGRLIFSTTADGAAVPTERLRITSAGVLQVADAGNISVGTTTGTKIGTATTQKLGFYDKTPVVQPAAVADATDAASVITQLNALLARMRDLGLIAT